MAVGRGRRVHSSALTLQANRRPLLEDADEARVGLTVTKKTGNAVERNRIKRRLRDALRRSEALSTDAKSDYVIVARREALSLPFARLVGELERAFVRAGAQDDKPRGAGKGGRRGTR